MHRTKKSPLTGILRFNLLTHRTLFELERLLWLRLPLLKFWFHPNSPETASDDQKLPALTVIFKPTSSNFQKYRLPRLQRKRKNFC